MGSSNSAATAATVINASTASHAPTVAATAGAGVVNNQAQTAKSSYGVLHSQLQERAGKAEGVLVIVADHQCVAAATKISHQRHSNSTDQEGAVTANLEVAG